MTATPISLPMIPPQASVKSARDDGPRRSAGRSSKTHGGLAPALKTLARRSPVPVILELPAGLRLPEQAELTAYYVVSEALANAAKHARASVVRVTVQARDQVVRLSVSDDGVGGADPARGSGLGGLADRVAAADGTLTVHSRLGQGTRLIADLPADTTPRRTAQN